MKRVKIYIFFSITYAQIFFPLLSKIDRFFDRRYIYISLSLFLSLWIVKKKKNIEKTLVVINGDPSYFNVARVWSLLICDSSFFFFFWQKQRKSPVARFNSKMELRRGGICRIFGGTLITHVERGMATGPWWNSNAFQHLNRHRVRPLVCWLLLKAPIQPGNFNDSNELTRETTVKFVNRTYTWLSARALILPVDTHFSPPGFISTSMKKHLREEKKENKGAATRLTRRNEL